MFNRLLQWMIYLRDINISLLIAQFDWRITKGFLEFNLDNY